MEIIQQIIDYIINQPYFTDVGSFFVFLLALLPFSPIPSEGIIVPLLALAQQAEIEHLRTQLILYMVIGETFSHSIVFYAVKYHLPKLTKLLGVSTQSIEKKHIHYGNYALLGLPSIIVAPFLTDLTVAYLAHKKQKFEHVAVFFVAGEAIRGLLYIFGVFSFFY